jgi:diphthine synthase
MGELLFIGLGLWDEDDITLKGLKEAKTCDHIFAEFYTSIVGVPTENLEKGLGKKITVLGREEIEGGERIIDVAKTCKVCLLIGGDPMAATTHVDLRLRALEEGIKTRVIHGVSIVSAAAGLLGLQIYKFGRTTTLVNPKKNFFPHSPYDVIKDNHERGLHSLVLLDIEDGVCMPARRGIELLLEIEKERKEDFLKHLVITVVSRASSRSPLIKAHYPHILLNETFGAPPHCIIVPGKLHCMEAKALVMLAGAPKEVLKQV